MPNSSRWTDQSNDALNISKLWVMTDVDEILGKSVACNKLNC